MNLEGFSFEPPPGFRTEDVTVSYRLGLPGSGPGPSLIVQTKPARPGADLGQLAGETLAELAQSVPGIKQASKSDFSFDDGGTGVLLAYSFATQAGELRQYFALRLAKGRLCTLTLTVPAANLNETSAKTFLGAIAAVKPS